MEKFFYNLLLVFMCFYFLSGCSPIYDEDDKRVVAQINKYKMIVSDLKYELENMPSNERYMLDTEKSRDEFMDRLLEKELLLQEAQRLGIDKEKEFMKSIENYWEQSLLKILIDRKGKEILKGIHIYDNEIEDYYKKSGEKLPLAKVKDDIVRVLMDRKETEAMEEWIEELKIRSFIKIDEDVLEEAISAY